MEFLNKARISEQIDEHKSTLLNDLMLGITFGSVSESYRVYNWKTEEYMNESVYGSATAAKGEFDSLDNRSDFLVVKDDTKENVKGESNV